MANILSPNQQSAFLPHNPKLAGVYLGYPSPLQAAGQYPASPAPLAAATNMYSVHNPHAQPSPSSGRMGGGTKRRERDEDDQNGHVASDDRGRGPSSDAMETRSPTPEHRARKGPNKRLRQAILASVTSAEKKEQHKEPELDVGMLLARLPPAQHLSILTNLITQRPELKAVVLAMIPRPTVVVAVNALLDASRKLRDAYPFSQPSSSSFGPSTGFGFGASAFSFGAAQPAMRPEYVLSRIRPAVDEFVATTLSYISYFSYRADSGHGPPAIEDAFEFLAALTQHVFDQQPITVTALCEALQPRLVEEWKAWVSRLSQAINSEGAMFALSSVESWVNRLESFSQHSQLSLGQDMVTIRDEWVRWCGWLIGRHPNALH